MKAWDTVIVKSDATVTTNEAGPDGKPGKDVTVPHPHAGRAGVVQSVTNDRDGVAESLVALLDMTASGLPQERATLLAADVIVHHVL